MNDPMTIKDMHDEIIALEYVITQGYDESGDTERFMMLQKKHKRAVEIEKILENEV